MTPLPPCPVLHEGCPADPQCQHACILEPVHQVDPRPSPRYHAIELCPTPWLTDPDRICGQPLPCHQHGITTWQDGAELHRTAYIQLTHRPEEGPCQHPATAEHTKPNAPAGTPPSTPAEPNATPNTASSQTDTSPPDHGSPATDGTSATHPTAQPGPDPNTANATAAKADDEATAARSAAALLALADLTNEATAWTQTPHPRPPSTPGDHNE